MECIISLLRMWFRSLTFSSSSSSAADSAAGDADDVEIPPLREKYDVFISFRGEDTRLGITSHLHQALEQSKIETYIDDRLQRGEEIGPALVEAIEKSRLSVIIFSKNYPSSTWCLKELVHILKCKERCGQMVIPVFYDISPSDIRNQQGSYAVAFAGLEKRFKDSIDKVQEWRNALTNAANLSGFDYSSNPWTEAVLVKKVVDDIWNKLIRESSCDLKGLVGIERRIEQIESLLCIHSPDACITVGIWGMGGIGKTTLAENVFHKLSSKFEASCFLRNVRENSEQTDGLDRLEKKLLKEILKKEDLSIGSTLVRESLSRTKVLIVLDDVSDSMQMDHLAGKRLQYGTGSRIIITSRDRRTLRPTVEEDKIYEVEGLKPDDALQLFCSRAFKNNSTPITDYKGLAEKAVDYAGGIPLALVLLGSSFLNCKSKEEWEDELNKLKEFPNENIHKALRLSYDRLGRNEKEIFLDIACFHKGNDVEELNGTPIVQAIVVDWYKIEEQTFADFKVMSNLMMLLVRYTRLFCTGTASLDLPNSRRYLYWFDYPLKSLPSSFSPENLVELHMPESGIKKLWNEEQRLVKLKVINLEWSRNLTEVPNLSGSRKIVHVKLSGCGNLVEIPGYFQRLDKLTHLDLGNCKSLKYLPEMPENIEILKLYASGIQELPDSVWSHEKISCLDITACRNLKKLPSNKCKLKISGCFYLWSCISLGQVSELPRNISELSMVGCTRLVSLPTDICKLKSLKKLKISWCFKLGNFPEILEPMEHLEHLNLKGTAVQELHSSIEFFPALKKIKLLSCTRLSSIPSSIYSLTNLKILRFRYCRKLKELPSGSIRLLSLEVLDLHGTRISEIPDGLVGSTSLQDLDLSRSMIRSIPASIKQASQLHRLSLIGCKRLQSLPELPVPCNLEAEGCTSLKTVPSSRTALTQGWDKYTYFGNRNFLNCRKLDHNARSNIMDEAQLIFMRNATKPRKKYWRPTFSVVCPGKEIPKWFSFSYQSEGSSVHIKLPPEFIRTGLLGFVLSIVVSSCNKWFVIRARCNVKSLGESHELFTSFSFVGRKSRILNDCCDDGQDHVYMWYESVISEKEAEMCSPDVYKLANEASVEFRVENFNCTPISSVKVKCGIWPLYAEDVEKFKLDRVFISREPKIQEETREDETWEASGSSYKNKANESDDESEASESSDDPFESTESDDESEAECTFGIASG